VPRIPGPLLRVTTGTVVEIRVTNQIPDSTLFLHGLHPGAANDTIHVTPGATRTTYFTAAQPGTYLYWATTAPGRAAPSETRTGPLAGAIVVDDPRQPPDPSERILVLTTVDILPDTTRPNRETMCSTLPSMACHGRIRSDFATRWATRCAGVC
jgi:FtsP/CotA-like multicopper oxidase with cupredoxin domain